MTLVSNKIMQLTSLVFAGAGDSNALSADDFGKFGAITIFAPTGAFAGTVTIQVGRDDPATGSVTYVTLQSPSGTDVSIVSAKAITLSPACFPYLRLHSTVNETLTFTVWGRLSSVTGV